MNTAPPSQIAKSAKSASIDKPAKAPVKQQKPKVAMTREQRQQLLVIGVAVAVVVGVGLAIYAYFSYTRAIHAPPRLDAEPVRIARFIATSDFDHLPFDRQRLYMK